jgi:hypothetical protein
MVLAGGIALSLRAGDIRSAKDRLPPPQGSA